MNMTFKIINLSLVESIFIRKSRGLGPWNHNNNKEKKKKGLVGKNGTNYIKECGIYEHKIDKY